MYFVFHYYDRPLERQQERWTILFYAYFYFCTQSTFFDVCQPFLETFPVSLI